MTERRNTRKMTLRLQPSVADTLEKVAADLGCLISDAVAAGVVAFLLLPKKEQRNIVGETVERRLRTSHKRDSKGYKL